MRSLLLSVMLVLAAFAGTARAAEPPDPAGAPVQAVPVQAAPVQAGPVQAGPVAQKGTTTLDALDVSPYYYDPASPGAPAQAGKRFLDDLKRKDPALWAAVHDATRYELQTDEARKFVHQRKFVIAAYAVLWSILIIFVVGMWQRQRKLSADLTQLEARLRAEDAKK